MNRTGEQLKNKQVNALPRSTVLDKINSWVEQTKELPSKPMLILNLLKMTGDVGTFNADLVEVLSKDKELAKNIIKRAKLPQESGLQDVTPVQLQTSIQRLGFELVQNEVEISFAKQFARLLRFKNDSYFKSLLKHCIRSAFIAKEIALLVGQDPALAFFTGLMHNIGQVIVALRDLRAFREITEMTDKGVDLKGAEFAILGFEHSELGTKMLLRWGMPKVIVDLSKNYEVVKSVLPENLKLALILKLSTYIAKCLIEKDKGPNVMWSKAKSYFEQLDYVIEQHEWDEKIRILFIKILQIEERIFAQ